MEETVMAIADGLSASLEDYLEAIFRIVAEQQAARPKDISNRLGVNHSSVTEAMQVLAEKGLVNYEPYGLITLTPEGTAAAETVAHRHEVLRDFFVKILAVPEEEADEVACKVEHVITQDIMEKLVCFLQFVETCPRGGGERIRGFSEYCEQASTQESEK